MPQRHSGSALNDWIEQNRPGEWRINSRIGAAVGRSRVSVTNWRKGVGLPDPEAMIAVARFTGGAVMPNDWFPELGRLAEPPAPTEKLAA